MPPPHESKSFRFDVAFSFAGPHREKVRATAELVAAQVGKKRVFFDEWYRAEILGGNMRVLLQRIYGEKSLMVVADLSNDYADRPWCQGEAEAIDALRMRIDSARDETARLRVFIVRFGPGNVPGVLDNTAWLDGINLSAEEIANVILERLQLLKERLAEEQSETTSSSAASATPTSSFSSPTFSLHSLTADKILFFHLATNDDRYSRRERELAWLDDCARDTGIRIATVTGQGGLGKTALVGHWIEKHHGWQHRAFRGVFFYSFYSNREPKEFFAAFLKFVCEVESFQPPSKDAELHHAAANVCRRLCYLVVLDGLEVLQLGEDDPHYGWIADSELTEYVARVGAEGASLLVLTSRFPFPRITDEHPAAARALELPLFTNAEGADLLAICGLNDLHPRLEGYSELLGGHPLALRIFAGACLEQPFDDPEKVSRDVRSAQGVETMPDPDEPGLNPEERRKRRQRRQFYKLLRWFQQKLSPPKRRLLQLVALFRDPVRTDTLISLAFGMDAMKADFTGCDAARIAGLLDQLSGQFLLQKGTSSTDDIVSWTAHPIVREVFREAALAAGNTVAAQFAEIVTGSSQGTTPRTIAELQPILEAIEVLLLARKFDAADQLYRRRLDNGYVFSCLPAPDKGYDCIRGFLEPASRRQELEASLGAERAGEFHHQFAIWAAMTGRLNAAAVQEQRSIDIARFFETSQQLSKVYSNLTLVQIGEGSLSDALQSAAEAVRYARPLGLASEEMISPDLEPRAHYYRAFAMSCYGRLIDAANEFAKADTLRRRYDEGHLTSRSLCDILWCRSLSAIGNTQGARLAAEQSRLLCEERAWMNNLARCDLLIGELDLDAGHVASAECRLVKALRIFRDARQDSDLPDALLAMARLRRGAQLDQRNAHSDTARPAEFIFIGDESAVSYCEESLRLAARSGFLLKKCDALNFRAQFLRESGQPEKAFTDAKEAHAIAQRCDYYWGLHEALRQLRDTAQALNRTPEFREWDKAERALTEKMKPEIAEALRINREHDEEMERLYGEEKR